MARKPLSGPGRYAINLVQSLAALDRENQYLILQDSSLSERITESDNFKTIWVDYPALSLRTVAWLQTLLRRERISVFHSLHFLAPLLGNFANIITVHDLMALTFPNFFQGRSLPVRLYAKLFCHAFIRSSLICSEGVITVSQVVREELIRWKPGCEGKITVIGEAVDPAFRKMADRRPMRNVRSKFGLTKKILLYVGNTRPYKNLPRLIKAFELLKKEKELSCQLVIGGGESRNIGDLKRLTKDLQLEDSVVFTGYLTDEEVIALMNAADIFVFPSLYEGFGLPPLEAMACGTPVVTSDAGSLPEVVGDAALLVDPKKEEQIFGAIKTLLSEEKLRRELVRRGHDRVKLFSWRKTAKETLEVYKRTGKKYGL
ncbi:MAG: glycosyltransferase family 4 protein [Candidatus Zixiibacteriota bacterium]|nr:MAG: glycosyltransferase family 4 protein [candidate division Zixibacteria bacterium]